MNYVHYLSLEIFCPLIARCWKMKASWHYIKKKTWTFCTDYLSLTIFSILLMKIAGYWAIEISWELFFEGKSWTFCTDYLLVVIICLFNANPGDNFLSPSDSNCWMLNDETLMALFSLKKVLNFLHWLFIANIVFCLFNANRWMLSARNILGIIFEGKS